MIIINRTGREPLAINGTIVSRACGKHYAQKPGESASDYWEITIYQQTDAPANAPPYVVAIAYHKEVRGQAHDHYFAELTDRPAFVLGKYDPLDVLVGYPPGAAFDDKQLQLETACQRQFQSLISDALKPFPENAADALRSQRDGELCDIFAHLCHVARRQWTFTRNEALAIVDACEFSFLGHDAFLLLPKEIANGIDNCKLVEKWGIDKCALEEKLQKLSFAGCAALAVSIRTFWEHSSKPSAVALTLAGFNFQ